MREFFEFLMCIVMLIVFAAAVMAVMFVPIYFFDKAACYAKTENFESRHGLFTGCQVQVNGYWVDWDNYRVADDRDS